MMNYNNEATINIGKYAINIKDNKISITEQQEETNILPNLVFPSNVTSEPIKKYTHSKQYNKKHKGHSRSHYGLINNYKLWTTAERELVKKYYLDGYTIKSIAKSLGRTEISARNVLMKHYKIFKIYSKMGDKKLELTPTPQQ